MSAMSNLSDLPHDMLVVIAKGLKKLEDFVSFRCVSKSSFAAAKDEYFEGLRLRQRTPYLMLPVRDDGDDDIRELYSLVEGESIVASVKVPNFKNKKCLESLGWLLVTEADGSMSLLEPFSGTEIPLPHQNTFPGYEDDVGMADEHIFTQKMVLSARPSDTSDFVLIVIAGGLGHLGFWRLGDKAWNRIEKSRMELYTDVVYHDNGQFYATGISRKELDTVVYQDDGRFYHPTCYVGVVRAFNFVGKNGNRVKKRLILRCEHIVPNFDSFDPKPVHASMNLYILKTEDSLLIITRMSPNLSEDGLHYMTSKFQVYEVDTDTGTWKEIYSLGSMAVIVGHNATIAVDASRSAAGRGRVIKPNHIYFTDDDWEYYYIYSEAKGGGKNIGVYNMETGTVEPIYPGEPLLSKVSTTIWITPCF